MYFLFFIPTSISTSTRFWLVHAGVIPEIPLEEQPRKSLLRGKMPWMKDAYDKSRGGWWEYYNGSTPLYMDTMPIPKVLIFKITPMVLIQAVAMETI